MANMLDYIAWRGDVPFAGSPFNPVDNLILSELCYADLDGIVSREDEGLTLAQVWARYRDEGRSQGYLINDPKPPLEAAAASRRFRDARVDRYVDEVDAGRQLQFAAMRFLLEDGTAYAAFRGTDNTLAGWREDFNLSYLAQTPAQAMAAAYLDELAGLDDRPLRVGGHSKGGNLALYAAAFCGEDARGRLVEVTSNDGPGFNRAVAEDPRFATVLEKSLLIVPEESLVGVLLDNPVRRMVVKSEGVGVLQHNPFNWQVLGAGFVPAAQGGMSQFMDETLSQWLDGLDDTQRSNLTRALFDTLEASGADTFTQLTASGADAAGSILKAAGALPPELQKDVAATLKKLADAGREVFLADARKAFQKGLEHLNRKR